VSILSNRAVAVPDSHKQRRCIILLLFIIIFRACIISIYGKRQRLRRRGTYARFGRYKFPSTLEKFIIYVHTHSYTALYYVGGKKLLPPVRRKRSSYFPLPFKSELECGRATGIAIWVVMKNDRCFWPKCIFFFYKSSIILRILVDDCKLNS